MSVLIAPASAAAKTFALSISPGSSGAGSTQTYSATITNESGGTLDSVTLAAPAGFAVTSPSGGQFTALGLGNGDSTTRNFTARTPCAAAGPQANWGASGRASNNQQYSLDAATSTVASSVTGACSLVISNVGSGERNALLSTVNYKPLGDPSNPAAVTVELRDAGGVNTTQSADGSSVALTLSSTPGALSGGSASLSGGVATFSSLKVTQASLAYTVSAAVPSNSAINGTTSNAFQIWDKDIKCQANSQCSQQFTSGDLTTTPSATFAADGGILVSYDVQSAAEANLCGTDAYNHLPNVVTIASETQNPTGDWVVTFNVSKQFDQLQAQNGASFYQLCLVTTVPFTTLQGLPSASTVIGSTTYYYGLVQSGQQCVEQAPCLVSKTKSKSGVVVLVLRLDAGDPWTH